MAKYEVTVAQLKQAQTELSSHNEQFLQRVNDLEAKQQELKAMWQGDANNAFDKVFNEDKDKWRTFAQLIAKYIEALEQIVARYEKGEAANVETARKRSY